MKRSIVNSRETCKEMLLLFSVFFLPGFLFQSGGTEATAFNNLLYNLQIVVLAVPQLLLLLYVLKLRGDDLTRFGFRPFRLLDVLHGFLAYLGIFAILLPLGTVAALLPERVMSGIAGSFHWQFSRLELLPAVIIASLATAYREEAFFRGYLLVRLQEFGAGSVPAVIAVSTLFAAGHLYQGTAAFVLAFVLGVYFSILFLRQRNIHAIAIGHALYNVTVLLISSTQLIGH